jgi:hypothetical protein
VSAEEENTNCKLLPGIGRIWYLWHRQDELLTAQFEHRKNSDVIGYSLISQVERHYFVELLILAILSDINQTLFGSVRFTLLYFYGHSLFLWMFPNMFYFWSAMVFVNLISFPSSEEL